jgi:hypothetical protein
MIQVPVGEFESRSCGLPQFRTQLSERGQVLRPSAPLAKVCYRGHSGKLMLVTSVSQFDPKETVTICLRGGNADVDPTATRW